jgi:hypothetical protein
MKVFNLMAVATALTIFCFGSTATAAHIIAGSLSETIVESRTGGLNFADYAEHGGGFPDSWTNSTAKSSAQGVTAGIGSRFNSTAGFGGWFEVSPTLPTAGGTYEVYVTVTSASGAITATTDVAATGGTGLPASTTAFSTAESANTWGLVGTLTLEAGVDTPIVRFTENQHSNRLYADAVLFAEMQVIPEPSTIALAGLALVGVACAARRRVR